MICSLTCSMNLPISIPHRLCTPGKSDPAHVLSFDRPALSWFLKHFQHRAPVFGAGPPCSEAPSKRRADDQVPERHGANRHALSANLDDLARAVKLLAREVQPASQLLAHEGVLPAVRKPLHLDHAVLELFRQREDGVEEGLGVAGGQEEAGRLRQPHLVAHPVLHLVRAQQPRETFLCRAARQLVQDVGHDPALALAHKVVGLGQNLLPQTLHLPPTEGCREGARSPLLPLSVGRQHA
eukprot:3347379-Rhodomonas_salina.2